MLKRAALGLRAHSGWAAAVAVGGSAKQPAVLQRWRLEIADRGIRGSVQPYHAAAEMKLPEAQAFIARCTKSTADLASSAIGRLLKDLKAQGYQLSDACVMLGSGKPIPDLEKILASHPMLHTAEGGFYRDAVKRACESCGVAASGVKEKELLNHAAAQLGLSIDELNRRVAALGKQIGPPWRQDEKLCAIGGWLWLAGL